MDDFDINDKFVMLIEEKKKFLSKQIIREEKKMYWNEIKIVIICKVQEDLISIDFESDNKMIHMYNEKLINLIGIIPAIKEKKEKYNFKIQEFDLDTDEVKDI